MTSLLLIITTTCQFYLNTSDSSSDFAASVWRRAQIVSKLYWDDLTSISNKIEEDNVIHNDDDDDDDNDWMNGSCCTR